MSQLRVVAIVQARMRSRRLPGKVLADLCGKPVLVWVVDRARRAPRVDSVWVATTTDPADEAVERTCRERGWECFRGHPTDVLDRFVHAARAAQADVVVRLTGDCPFTDPGLIQQAVETFLTAEPPVSLVVNRLPWDRSYPIGLDIEVCSRGALERADAEAMRPHQREHVIPFLYENPDQFPFLHLESGGPWGSYRWTVDEEPDLRFVREVCSRFHGRDDFTWRDVLSLIEADPGLAGINQDVRHKGHGEAESAGTR